MGKNSAQSSELTKETPYKEEETAEALRKISKKFHSVQKKAHNPLILSYLTRTNGQGRVIQVYSSGKVLSKTHSEKETGLIQEACISPARARGLAEKIAGYNFIKENNPSFFDYIGEEEGTDLKLEIYLGNSKVVYKAEDVELCFDECPELGELEKLFISSNLG